MLAKPLTAKCKLCMAMALKLIPCYNALMERCDDDPFMVK